MADPEIQGSSVAVGEPAALKFRLSIMMFLEFAIWGAWYPVASTYFGAQLGFNGSQIGWLFSLIPLACIISPFIGGQIADRYLPTQVFLGLAHLVAGLCMLIVAPKTAFMPVLVLLGIWSIVFSPTLALTNSICFHHLKNAQRDFGKIRFWGTLGWILAGWAVTMWLWLTVKQPESMGALSFLAGPLSAVNEKLSAILGRVPNPQMADIFNIAGILSIIMGVFCFLLPHTPPARKGENPLAFLEAFKLCRDGHFLLFLVISFVVGTQLMFFFIWVPAALGVSHENVPIVMTLAQALELVTMALLPVLIPFLGMRKALTIGILGWPVLFAVFALAGNAVTPKVCVLAFHGIGYALFLTVAFIYVDSVAEKQIKASAQALLTFMLFGLGMFIGSKFAGYVKDVFTSTDPATQATTTNWTSVFAIPCILLVVSAVVLFIFFREPVKKSAR